MTLNKCVCVLLLGFLTFSLGCGDRKTALLKEFKELNKSSVARARSCFLMYASRHDMKSPKSQEELIEFLKGGTVDRNLERLGVSPDEIDSVFVSERDGQPLKVKWGMRIDPDNPKPIAFETVGVDGIRLVSADVILEVDNEQEYQALWDGKYDKGGPVNGQIDIE